MYDDLERSPLPVTALTRALSPEGWELEVVAKAESTQSLVRERAQDPRRWVVVAEEQTAGRGRQGRSWVSPPRAGLTFSVLVRPDQPRQEWGWIPLLAGLAVARAIREQAELDAVLKWPNDVLLGEQKVCGILAELTGDAIVLGIGLNVTTRAEELPHDQATSLLLAGATMTDRATLLKAVLRSLAAVLGDQPFPAYREWCSTLGRQVRVDLPGGESVTGLAEAVDEQGRLVVDGRPYAAGDVVHLRSVDGGG
jgi:BirA family biotin operon repressor/biotin-[acetyl-CoA-carboxylase] ligase